MNVRKIKVKDIIPPTGRARVNYGDVASLKESIEKQGLINPITVQPIEGGKYKIIAGERRWRAIHSLDWEEVDAVVLPADLGDLDAKVIELHENLMRKDFDWVEEVRLKKQIHELQLKLHGEKTSTAKDADGWSLRMTAAMLGESPANVSRDIQLAQALDIAPEISKLKTKNEAAKILKGAANMVKAQEVEAAVKAEVKSNPDSTKQKMISSYIIGDFFEEAKKLQPESFDIIELDPPYGIDLQNVKRNAGGDLDSYDEVSAADYENFITEVIRVCVKLLKKNGWMIVWYAPEPHAETVFKALELFKLSVRRMPALWVKPNGQTMQPDKYLGNNYEPFYYARKGAAVLAKRGHNATFYASKEPSGHPTAKPVSLMVEILSTFGRPGDSVLVPFAGSGSTLIAAHLLGMTAIGYDKSDYYRSVFVNKVGEVKVDEYINS